MKKLSFVPGMLAVLIAAPVLHAQTLASDKASLSLSALSGGAAVSQTLNITATGNASTFFAAFPSNNTPWLTVSPQSANTPAAITVTADPKGLNANVYSGSVTVNNAQNSVTIPVTFTVTSIGASPAALAFAFTVGGALPGSQGLTLSGAPTTFTAAATTTSGGSWLQASPATGASPGSLTVSVNQSILQGLAAATYTGAVTITPTSGPSNTPVTVPVTLVVSPTPPVTIAPATVSLNFQIGGANNQASQALTLATTSGTPLSFGFTSAVGPNPSGRNWLLINPPVGTIPANGNTAATASYDSTANLPAGTYTGTLTATVAGASFPAQNTATCGAGVAAGTGCVPVSLLVSMSPLLSVPGAPLNFTYELGSAALPAAQNVTATSSAVLASSPTGQMPIAIAPTTASGGAWLQVSATNSTTGTPFGVSVNPAGLVPGTYNGTITVTGTGAGNGAQTIPVTLTVANDPLIVTSVNALSFPFQIGQTAPAAQTINVSSSNGGLLNYAATAATTACGNAWLVLGGATSGTTPGGFTVAVAPAGLAAGTCTGTITITATNAVTGVATVAQPAPIPVTLFVSNNPLLVTTPTAPLVFTAPQGGALSPPQTITLSSTNPASLLNYTVAFNTANGGNNWLLVGPMAGSTAQGANTISVSVNPGGLSSGTYSGTITLTATGTAAVANSPVTVPVTLQVTAGTIAAAPASLTFAQTQGAAAPATQTIQVTSSGQALNYSAVAANSGAVAWLSVTPTGGTTPGTLTVSVDGSKLATGTYNGTITITSPNAGGSPLTVPVTLTVAAGTIAASPTSLSFSQLAGGTPPANQAISVTGSPVALPFTVSTTTASGGTWLMASTAQQSTPSTVGVSVNAGNLAVGTYTGTVTITSAGATGSPIAIPVTFTVLPAQTLTLSPLNLTFNYTVGAVAPAGQTIQVASSGTNAPFSVSAATTSGGNWLAVAPASANTPAAITVTVTPQALAVGTYSGTVMVNSPSALASATATVTLVVALPTPVLSAIKNAASYSSGVISPGENILLGGTNFGPQTLVHGQLTASGAVATTISNTQVLFDGTPAPIIYVTSGLISVMVPYEVAGRPTTAVQVVSFGVPSAPLTYTVAASAPGIYTQNFQGTGPGAILNQDNSVNGPNNPESAGRVITVYMTGEGQSTPPGATGLIAPLTLAGQTKPILPVTAMVGNVPATVTYAGSSPGIIFGVMQVDLVLPSGLTSGPQAITITLGTGAGAFTTQLGVTAAVK